MASRDLMMNKAPNFSDAIFTANHRTREEEKTLNFRKTKNATREK